MRLGILDPKTKQVRIVEDVMEWGRWFEQTEDRVVRQDYVGEWQVSTVFLGIDHGWRDGAPLWFETMVFGGPLDLEGRRYTSYEAAQTGHREMLEQVIRCSQPTGSRSPET